MQKFTVHESNANPINFDNQMPISQVPAYLRDEVIFAINNSEALSATQQRLTKNFGTQVTLIPRTMRDGFSMIIEFEVPYTIKAKSQILNNISTSVRTSVKDFERTFSNITEYVTCAVREKSDSASINFQVNVLDIDLFPNTFYLSSGFGSYFTPESPDPARALEALKECYARRKAGETVDFFDIGKAIYDATWSQSPVRVTVRYINGAPAFDVNRSRS